ncbi:MAG: hypothetical protein PHI06_15055 [Desulfobulbaceae bacterium]|nr:hypothetical protein [Desulfobulbaceae bacterium]
MTIRISLTELRQHSDRLREIDKEIEAERQAWNNLPPEERAHREQQMRKLDDLAVYYAKVLGPKMNWEFRSIISTSTIDDLNSNR